MKQKVNAPKSRDTKKNGVQVQKGNIDACQYTMMTKTPEMNIKEDSDNRILKKSGQMLNYHSPKK